MSYRARNGIYFSANSVVAKARGEYVRSHFKNTREVAAAISGEYC